MKTDPYPMKILTLNNGMKELTALANKPGFVVFSQ